ncbi:spirocyclase AveC family protein [Mycobacterium sp. 29Ha]|uniref:spirocyclase AveC family protein n=1 Tax=Mycobacterium sp. 29Ha TaxID=2939268 RepID=UPI0029393314|nr:spirocyclase AveC family protein [Mycobacterium sp. 29Ha]MDV3130548.1 spirocyclase AveC family protein [Mycobacterium sp. 29Ha]
MSGPSKKPTVTESISRTAVLGTETPRPSSSIKIWATVGAVFLALTVYLFVRWVSGPYFEPVASGPSEPPMYMKIPLIANAVVLWIGLPFALWFFIIRPWWRERRITLDGMLLVSMALMMFQDPMLNYYSTWCTYNAWLFNQGSWAPYIPGWVAHEEPGHTVPEPLLTNIPGYMYGVLLLTIVGCALMRKIKSRWPGISNLRLVLVTYAIAIVFDFIMEGLILLPIGFYSYPGAIQSLSINAGTYYQYPIYEGLMWGGVQAALCCLRFFTDDRGRTVVERGLDQIRGGFVKQQFVRFLAIFGGVSACFFLFYNVPATWLGTQADPWPEDVQKRSYFNPGICGDGTDRPCPNPDLPLTTHRSGFVNHDGELVLPEGVEIPPVVPIQGANGNGSQ